MLTKNAMGNLLNKYVAVLRKCTLLNACVLGLACGLCGGVGDAALDLRCAYASDNDVSMTDEYDPISLDNIQYYKVDVWNDDLAYQNYYEYSDQTIVWWGQHGHAGKYLNFFDDVVMDENSNLVFDFDNNQSGHPYSIAVGTTAAIYLGTLDSRDTTDSNITWDVDYSDTLSITGGSLWAIGPVDSPYLYRTYGAYILDIIPVIVNTMWKENLSIL